MQTVIPRPQRTLLSPLEIANLAAWYDVGDPSSLVYDGSNRVSLIADKSGNSATNVLCINGANGNYASTPDSAALDITGDIDLRVRMSLVTWTPSSPQYVLSKWNLTGANNNSYTLGIMSSGKIQFGWSVSGITALTADSSVATGFAAFSTNWIRVTFATATGTATFYISSDGTTWTQLGTTIVSGATSIFNSNSALHVGCLSATANDQINGNVYRAQIYNGIGGTLVFDANFATASKLATSFTESSSNAATVTITSSGEFGARISGERDYCNLLSANQLIYSSSARSVTGDGSSQSLRTARFSLAQPYTRYTVIKQVSWTSGDYLLDGANGANSGAITQTTATPQINMNAGSSVAANTDLTVGTLSVLIQDFNGASSSLQVGAAAATTGNAGATAANGLTLCASGASTAANHGNAEVCEDLVYAGTHSATTRAAIRAYLRAKWETA